MPLPSSSSPPPDAYAALFKRLMSLVKNSKLIRLICIYEVIYNVTRVPRALRVSRVCELFRDTTRSATLSHLSSNAGAHTVAAVLDGDFLERGSSRGIGFLINHCGRPRATGQRPAFIEAEIVSVCVEKAKRKRETGRKGAIL